MFEDKEIRIADLKAQVNDLTKELHDSGVEGNATIEEWQTSYAKLENMLDAALKENEELKGKHAGALNASEVENKDVRIADHSAEVDNLAQQMQESEADAAETIDQ